MRLRQVVVIGSGDDSSFLDTAYEIGRYVAEKKWVLISGGKGGIMESASKGAFEAGGIVIGILPEQLPDSANKYCSIVIPTGIGYARNLTNVLSGDVIVSIGGKAGTLSEIAYAWQFRKPVIACAFTGGWSGRLAGSKIDDRKGSEIYNAKSLKEVFACLDRVLEQA
ncbi:MAG: TIGR00725 family protein [Spirochaetes bacterium]|nr:TIGR00725 family protein [Spirochaetota bacterium]